MKEEKSFTQAFGEFMLTIIAGVFLTLYKVNLIEHIVKWYEIPVNLTTKQWYGLVSIIGLLIIKLSKDRPDDYSTRVKLFGLAILISIMYGVMYLVHLFL